MLRSGANDALVMHEDSELAELIGAEVRRRETVREWPLSWTQRIELADGRAFAYKSQLAPLLESAFYAACDSPLLPGCRVLGRLGECSTVLVDWIDSPSLADLDLSADDLLAHTRAVVDLIGELDRGLPVYLDVGTSARWTAEVAATIGKLRRLMTDGRFPGLAPHLAGEVESWAGSAAVLERIETDSRLVHRDLKPEHVFPVEGGYRVIDWQVPSIAPAGVDLVWMLAEAHLDPRPHVDLETYRVAYFLHLRWAVVAQHGFFPAFPIPLFEGWASDALARILTP